jgi:two-component system NtrC family sensor kinase
MLLAPVELARPAVAAALEQIPIASAPRVLVVEDEPTVASLIADLFREEGMRVDVLLDGRHALQQAERETYDLAICDVKMPGIDGQRFYQILAQRQNPLHEHVLFVTGDILAPRTQEFLDRHHLAHVAKPFRMEELNAAVQAMLGKKKEMAALKAAVRAKQA